MRGVLAVFGMAFLSVFTQQAFAGSSCSLSPHNESCTIHGAQITTSIENATSPFSPGQPVTFLITITNNGTDALSDATITDIFPQFVDFTNGPGHFDINSRQVNFPLPTLLPGTSQTFTLTGVVNGTGLDTNQPTCVAHTAFISVNNQSAQDSSQLCIQPLLARTMSVPADTTITVSPSIPSQSPATGANAWEWILIAGAGIGGYFIKKFQSTSYNQQTNHKFQ